MGEKALFLLKTKLLILIGSNTYSADVEAEAEAARARGFDRTISNN